MVEGFVLGRGVVGADDRVAVRAGAVGRGAVDEAVGEDDGTAAADGAGDDGALGPIGIADLIAEFPVRQIFFHHLPISLVAARDDGERAVFGAGVVQRDPNR